jgi:uroporphyrin-III C-methyltransferase/precorrin-2 dehydrogenase/sirohydrochlorin ferrochelatase/uroporphyrin-III C-methyltransferase
LASGVRFVTGHCREDADLDLNWESLADPDTTLVAYMALANLPQISRELIAAGLSPSTPAAAIASGTLPNQKLCRATLAELPKRVAEAGLKPPVLTVIGRVVALADVMSADADETAPPERLAGHG